MQRQGSLAPCIRCSSPMLRTNYSEIYKCGKCGETHCIRCDERNRRCHRSPFNPMRCPKKRVTESEMTWIIVKRVSLIVLGLLVVGLVILLANIYDGRGQYLLRLFPFIVLNAGVLYFGLTNKRDDQKVWYHLLWSVPVGVTFFRDPYYGFLIILAALAVFGTASILLCCCCKNMNVYDELQEEREGMAALERAQMA